MHAILAKNTKQIMIAGQVLQFDTLELSPNTSPMGIAIIFHPDPKAGGTNTNKVVQQVAKTLTNKGYICYCPNLRGVGLSSGVHDNGIGEVDDAYEIYSYLVNLHPNLPVIIGGFSFGSAIASALSTKVMYQYLILLGPAVTRYKVVIEDRHKTLVIHGDQDEIIPLADVLDFAKNYDQVINIIPNCGHFFHGKLLELGYLIDKWI